MRKIIGIIFISLMFANIGFAEMRVIESNYNYVSNIKISTLCVDGYKFVVSKQIKVNSISMVQAFEERGGKSLPTKC